mmetsp:Transcript_24601/g.69034  ORF Transcript_24601/g.69034 Transcript_24601/m.69034 type:complete len:152 (-) Transcript_24601:176-631(-)
MAEEATTHGKPTEGMMCLCTMEDITNENYVEYYTNTWKPCLYEESVVKELLKTQFHNYIQRVKTTDCQAELKRLLTSGPPIYVSDKHAFPDSENDITKLWFSSTNEECSGKLDGAVEGDERMKLWEELKQFIIVEGKEPGDDDDGNANAES